MGVQTACHPKLVGVEAMADFFDRYPPMPDAHPDVHATIGLDEFSIDCRCDHCDETVPDADVHGRMWAAHGSLRLEAVAFCRDCRVMMPAYMQLRKNDGVIYTTSYRSDGRWQQGMMVLVKPLWKRMLPIWMRELFSG